MLCDIVQEQRDDFKKLEYEILDVIKKQPHLIQRLPRNFEVFIKKMNIHFPQNLGILTEKEIIQKLATALDNKIHDYNEL